ncbi:MAG: Na+/H+ antiporter subunit E [candidate division WOR-3 bacterium]
MKVLSRWLYSTIAYLLVWIVLTGTIRPDELATGFLISALLALFTFRLFTTEGLKNLHPKKVILGILYIFPFMLWQMVKANLDVAYRVIHPKRPIKPGIVKVKTQMKSDLGKLLVANSITLTPGTFTMMVDGDDMLIHWIDVKTDDIEKASKMIPGVFEKWLLKFME